MPESPEKEEKSIRIFILSDVLRKIPIEKSYEDFCRIIGNDVIAFYDFQYWYYQFSNRNQDLDFDRSSEPEPLQFSDLPVDAVGLIVDKLEVVDRLMLRRVSKPLRDFIETHVIDCNSINVSFGDDLIRVWYGDGRILYAKNEEAVEDYVRLYQVRRDLIIIYEDESDVADDVACFLKNPKLQFDYLEFSEMSPRPRRGVVIKFFRRLEFVLKSLNHQIAVRDLSLFPEHPDDILAILPYLKSGYLEKIRISDKLANDDWKNDENSRKVEQIIQLEQWKQAKELHLLDALHLFPDEVLLQSKNYIIHLQLLDQDQLDRIKMKFASSPVFEKCTFLFCIPSEREDFLDFIGTPGPPIDDFRYVRYYLIPNTDKSLVFTAHNAGIIEVEKRTRVVQ